MAPLPQHSHLVPLARLRPHPVCREVVAAAGFVAGALEGPVAGALTDAVAGKLLGALAGISGFRSLPLISIFPSALSVTWSPGCATPYFCPLSTTDFSSPRISSVLFPSVTFRPH